MSKEFDKLTLGELKALTQTEIDEYAPALGAKYLEEHKEEFHLRIGRRIVADHIKKVIAIGVEMNGE